MDKNSEDYTLQIGMGVPREEILIHLIKQEFNHGSDSFSKIIYCGCTFFLMIDPTSNIAEQFRDKYMQDGFYYDIIWKNAEITDDIKSLSDKEIVKIVENVLLAMGISTEEVSTRDERIEQAITKIISGEWLSYSGICI